MADEHDDLLNFDDGDFPDGTLNEDELLLSDEENFDEPKEIIKKQVSPPQPAAPQKHEPPKKLDLKPEKIAEKLEEKIEDVKQYKKEEKIELEPKSAVPEVISAPKKQDFENKIQPTISEPKVQEIREQLPKSEQKDQPAPKPKTPEPDHHHSQFPEPQEEQLDYEEQQSQPESENQQQEDEQMPESSVPIEQSDLPQNHQPDSQDANQFPPPPHLQQHHQQFPMGPRHFRPQKFGPRGMPRWMNPAGPVPFPPQQRPLRPPQMAPIPPPGGRMPLNGPPQMRPGGQFPPQRGPFFMQQRPGTPVVRPGPGQRFFFQNQPGTGPAPSPSYVPTPIAPNAPPMPRKVLINPNFKGGIEAVKTQLLKEHFSSQSMSEEELLRKQQEFINSNMRSIEKRRHERSPSPNYRRSYSHSPSPPRAYRRRPFRPYERRRSMGDRDGNKAKEKDENLPEEDEETRAYRLKIETQRKQREELLRQKELRRKQQMEAKAKETEPLKPIVVTEKKIILTKKPRLEEKSTTPPIDDAPLPPTLTTQRRIVLKSAKDAKNDAKSEAKIGIAGNEKKKLQKIIKAEN